MVADTVGSSAPEELGVIAVWTIVWRGRIVVLAVATVMMLAAAIYVFVAPQWFSAETTLVPASSRSSQGVAGQLGGAAGLASLVGLNVSQSSTAEPLAVLKSRDFAREFIEEQNLARVLLPDSPTVAQSSGHPPSAAGAPDLRDSVKFFDERVLSVQEDKRSGLVTVAVEWTDPDLAAAWANMLVERLNERMREKALADAESNIAFLKRELGTTNVVPLEQSTARLLQNELEKLMLAKGNKEFAFRIVDRAEPPKHRIRPQRALTIALAAIVGVLLASIALVARAAYPGRAPDGR